MTIFKDASYSNRTLKVDLSTSQLKRDVLQELRSLQGPVKDTEFNRVDVDALDVDFLKGGALVTGEWQAQHRERVFFNFAFRPVHSPWISLSGWFKQYFQVSIINGVLNVVPTDNEISSSNWYSFFVDLLVSWTNTNGALRNGIKNALREFNGKNLTRTLMCFKGEIAQKSGLSVQQVEKIINATSTLNATLEGSLIRVSIVVP